MTDHLTIGQTIVFRHPGDIARSDNACRMATEIDAAIADAFRTGFEHACAGGKEASRKLPQLKDAMPLVLYFASEIDRQEFADMIHEVKPHMVEVKVPEGA